MAALTHGRDCQNDLQNDLTVHLTAPNKAAALSACVRALEGVGRPGADISGPILVQAAARGVAPEAAATDALHAAGAPTGKGPNTRASDGPVDAAKRGEARTALMRVRAAARGAMGDGCGLAAADPTALYPGHPHALLEFAAADELAGKLARALTAAARQHGVAIGTSPRAGGRRASPALGSSLQSRPYVIAREALDRGWQQAIKPADRESATSQARQAACKTQGGIAGNAGFHNIRDAAPSPPSEASDTQRGYTYAPVARIAAGA